MPFALLCAFGLSPVSGPSADPDPIEAFDLTLEEARAVAGDPDSDLATKQSAARHVGTAFLRIPIERAGRMDRILDAAEWSLFGQRSDWALDFANEAVDKRIGGDRGFVALWRAHLEGGDAKTALELAFAARNEHPVAMRDFVLVARGLAQGALFSTAAREILRGRTELGLMPFEVAARSGSAIDLQNLALSHRFLGRLDEARQGYEAALEIAPDDDEIWNDYGICLKVSGDTEAAIRAFEKSVEMSRQRYGEPGQGPGLTNLAMLSLRGLRDVPDGVLSATSEILRVRTTGALARRLHLDALLRRAR